MTEKTRSISRPEPNFAGHRSTDI